MDEMNKNKPELIAIVGMMKSFRYSLHENNLSTN